MTARPPEFDAILMRYLPALKKLAAKMTRFDRQEREDLINDTIVACLGNWQKYREDGGFYSWMVFMLRDRVRARRQAWVKHTFVDDIAGVPEWRFAMPAPQEHAVEVGQVMAEIDRLGPTTATVFRMLGAGFTGVEIAAEIGVSPQAVANRIGRHRPRLVAALGYGAAA